VGDLLHRVAIERSELSEQDNPMRAQAVLTITLASLTRKAYTAATKYEAMNPNDTTSAGNGGGSRLDVTKRNSIAIGDVIERIGYGRFQRRLLFVTGFGLTADSSEVLLLSYLSTVLHIYWNLSRDQAATLVSAVFAGQIVGSLFLGFCGDRLGRKPIIVASNFIIAVFELASAWVSGFVSIVILRFFVGVGIGGLTVPFDLLCEFLPAAHRGKTLASTNYFWTIGSFMVILFASVTLGSEGRSDDGAGEWRVFVLLCSIPSIISTALSLFVIPESPRWLLTKGRNQKAMHILQKISSINGKDSIDTLPSGTELQRDILPEGSNVCKLLSANWRRATFLTWLLSAGGFFAYYSLVLFTVRVFSGASNDERTASDDHSYSFDFGALSLSSSSEIVGLTIALAVVDKFGRIRTQVLGFCFAASMVLALGLLSTGLNTSVTGVQVATAFLARMALEGAIVISCVTVAELYTTGVRATATGVSNTFARVGAFGGAYLIWSSLSLPAIGGVICSVTVLTAGSALLLPETKGRFLGTVVVEGSSSTESDGEEPRTML